MVCSAWATSDYRVDGHLGQGIVGPVSQLTIGTNDTLCVLENSGKVTIFNSTGTVVTAFSTGLSNTDALAISPTGNLYVLSTLTKKKKVKVGARMRTIYVPVGVECGVFDPTGKKIRIFPIKGLKSAQAAHIINGKLVVADMTARSLVVFDFKTGKETARVKKGLRLCCNIFDFCAGPDGTIAVSNLGAFNVSHYSLDGTLLSKFGKRGRKIADFQGCCNPVSAGYLPDGRILTVEKDPTRIKIYDANGQNPKLVEGVEELVKGCEFIPVAIDSKGTVYLAAETKGYIVRCVPKDE
jgi:sugar lactone lactonase YvrE